MATFFTGFASALRAPWRLHSGAWRRPSNIMPSGQVSLREAALVKQPVAIVAKPALCRAVRGGAWRKQAPGGRSKAGSGVQAAAGGSFAQDLQSYCARRADQQSAPARCRAARGGAWLRPGDWPRRRQRTRRPSSCGRQLSPGSVSQQMNGRHADQQMYCRAARGGAWRQLGGLRRRRPRTRRPSSCGRRPSGARAAATSPCTWSSGLRRACIRRSRAGLIV